MGFARFTGRAVAAPTGRRRGRRLTRSHLQHRGAGRRRRAGQGLAGAGVGGPCKGSWGKRAERGKAPSKSAPRDGAALDSAPPDPTSPQLGAEYGPVFTVHRGRRRAVVLWGYEAVQEALEDRAEAFGGRGRLAAWEEALQGFGLLLASGERWQQLRQFSLVALQDLGPGERSVEARIQEEARHLVEEFRKTEGSPFDPAFLLSRAASGVICSVVFGQRFGDTDETFLNALAKSSQALVRLSSTWGQLYEMFSWAMRFLPGAHRQLLRDLEDVRRFIAERVSATRASLDRANPRGVVDCFLVRMEKEVLSPTTEFHLRNLAATVFDLFFLGTETVSATLSYGLLLLLKHPQVAEKVSQEIQRVIGPHRMPAVADRSHMPYTDAVIHEIQRVSDVIPMNFPHALTQDTHFRGYTIPKGTEVLPVLSSVLRDPSHFHRPDSFDPGHFLDAQGGFRRNDAFMPFSAGKRVCMGQALARMELFLFLTAILQSFTLQAPGSLPDMGAPPQASGFVRAPPSYRLCAVPRGAGSEASEEPPKDRPQEEGRVGGSPLNHRPSRTPAMEK
ncbi:cytochrome P450 2G1-like [Pelodiscus sinensis]|uniref:cytochrome P450 2G1-like n=1 Tax=Pelodiscus sinensis TaxID=13735 RepID=UPI003F6D5092